MARSRYKVNTDSDIYFATSSVVNRLHVFSVPEAAQAVLDAMKFLHEKGGMRLHAYVLMEDHLHLIGSSSDFSAEMRKFKSFTARGIIKLLQEMGRVSWLEDFKVFRKAHKKDQRYQVWQEGFHPKAIMNEAMLLQKIEYVHNNPVRRGYVDCPEHWRYSSSRQYAGEEGLVPIEPVL